MDKFILAIATAAVAGSGMWEFLKWLIGKMFGRKSANEAIMSELQDIRSELASVREEARKDRAVTSRVRILDFCDDLQVGRKHSKDSFDQVMSDITEYNRYCVNHPEFKNNQTATTVNYISEVYRERLQKHDFI